MVCTFFILYNCLKCLKQLNSIENINFSLVLNKIFLILATFVLES